MNLFLLLILIFFAEGYGESINQSITIYVSSHESITIYVSSHIKVTPGTSYTTENYLFDENTTLLQIRCKIASLVNAIELTYQNRTSHTYQHLKTSRNTDSVSYEMSLNKSCDGGKIICEAHYYTSSHFRLRRGITLLQYPRKNSDIKMIPDAVDKDLYNRPREVSTGLSKRIYQNSLQVTGATTYGIWIGVAFAVLVLGILGAWITFRFRRHHGHQASNMAPVNVEHENSLDNTGPNKNEYYYSYAFEPVFNLFNYKARLNAQPTLKEIDGNETSIEDTMYEEIGTHA